MKMRKRIVAVLVAVSACKTVERVEPTPDEKIARIMMLEDERSLGRGEIVSRLAEPDPRVRRRAAIALGRIGAPEAAGPLTKLLSDEAEPVRAAAAFALGLIEGPLSAEAITALEASLSDPSAEVRGRAAEALGRTGTEGAAEKIGTSLFATLPAGPAPFAWGEEMEQSALRLPHPDLRLGLFALSRLDSLRWSWSLLATDEMQPRFLWWPAAWAASRYRAPELAPLLLHYAGSNDPFLRLLGARGLAGLPLEHSRRALTHLLDDPDEKVRVEAVRAAASAGFAEAVPRLLEILQGDTLPAQVEAAKALGFLPDRRTVDPLIDRLPDPNPWIRAAVLPALAAQDPESFWLLLSGLDPDPEWTVRAALARVLADMGGSRSVTLLQSMVDDRDYRVRPHALAALAKADPEAAVPTLIERLTAGDPFERAAAARELGRLKPPGGVEALHAAHDFAARDQEPDARLAVLSALEAYGADAVEPAARKAMDDPSWSVRKRAEAILRTAGDTSVSASAVVTGRSFEEYLQLLHPLYSPQAFIRTEKGAIEVELFVVDAPLTVANFMRLARDGFYDGQTFHRVLPNYEVEAGDPRGDSNGGPGYSIRCEINTRPFLRGTLGMALSGKDTGGSRFFITLLPQPQRDGGATAFGQVIGGMTVVDRLEPGDLIREIVIWDGVSPPGGTAASERR